MRTSSLELLEKSLLLPAQARAILSVMESELTLYDTALVTKCDLQEVRHDLELKIEGLRADLVGEIKGTIRWNFAFWIAQLPAIAGILKLLK